MTRLWWYLVRMRLRGFGVFALTYCGLMWVAGAAGLGKEVLMISLLGFVIGLQVAIAHGSVASVTWIRSSGLSPVRVGATLFGAALALGLAVCAVIMLGYVAWSHGDWDRFAANISSIMGSAAPSASLAWAFLGAHYFAFSVLVWTSPLNMMSTPEMHRIASLALQNRLRWNARRTRAALTVVSVVAMGLVFTVSQGTSWGDTLLPALGVAGVIMLYIEAAWYLSLRSGIGLSSLAACGFIAVKYALIAAPFIFAAAFVATPQSLIAVVMGQGMDRLGAAQKIATSSQLWEFDLHSYRKRFTDGKLLDPAATAAEEPLPFLALVEKSKSTYELRLIAESFDAARLAPSQMEVFFKSVERLSLGHDNQAEILAHLIKGGAAADQERWITSGTDIAARFALIQARYRPAPGIDAHITQRLDSWTDALKLEGVRTLTMVTGVHHDLNGWAKRLSARSPASAAIGVQNCASYRAMKPAELFTLPAAQTETFNICLRRALVDPTKTSAVAVVERLGWIPLPVPEGMRPSLSQALWTGHR